MPTVAPEAPPKKAPYEPKDRPLPKRSEPIPSPDRKSIPSPFAPPPFIKPGETPAPKA